ncbi:hypothetical protein EDD85DRAFT_492047 [Armillaria nabsnona]|nr:hypothetical protein EDD85DRAFT_492047 [Armillaria nabsnona]
MTLQPSYSIPVKVCIVLVDLIENFPTGLEGIHLVRTVTQLDPFMIGTPLSSEISGTEHTVKSHDAATYYTAAHHNKPSFLMHSDGVVNLSQSISDSIFEDEGTSSPTLSEDGDRFDFDENLPKRGKDVESRYENLPEVTLSAFDETGRKEDDIKVIKQRRFTGRKPVISSHCANQSCSELTIDDVLG